MDTKPSKKWKAFVAFENKTKLFYMESLQKLENKNFTQVKFLQQF